MVVTAKASDVKSPQIPNALAALHPLSAHHKKGTKSIGNLAGDYTTLHIVFALLISVSLWCVDLIRRNV